jgi:hypothetical protein
MKRLLLIMSITLSKTIPWHGLHILYRVIS